VQELAAQGFVVEHLAAQPHACDRRFQVVRDGAQQLGALEQVVAHARLHRIERADHAAHFFGAVLS